jgi:GxxExxY protein
MSDMKRDERTYEIIEAAMEVHGEKGYGFLEPVYQESFAIELELRGIPFAKEIELPVFYKDRRLSCVIVVISYATKTSSWNSRLSRP